MNLAWFDAKVAEIAAYETQLAGLQARLTSAIAATTTCTGMVEVAARATVDLTSQSTRLTGIAADTTAEIDLIQANITAAQARLAPLLVAPTNLATMLTWATAVIETFAGPNAALIAQQAEVAAQVVRIANAVTGASAAVTATTTTITNEIATRRAQIGCV